MTFIVACILYLAVFAAVAVISEKYTPLVGIGGLLVLLALGRWLV